MNKILDKFAVRIVLLAGFSFIVILIGLYLLLWINEPGWAAIGTVIVIVFWSLDRVFDRDLRIRDGWK